MEIIIFILLLIGALLILVLTVTEMINFVQTRVPFVPTAAADILNLVDRVKISEQDYVYDLGSGNGKVVFLMEQFTGARAKGFQRGGWTQWYAKLKKRLIGSKAEFVTGNFFDHPWGEATVIYAYLYPFLMRSVADKAVEDCRPGTRLVIRDFALPNLSPVEQWQTPTNHTMYLYVIE